MLLSHDVARLRLELIADFTAPCAFFEDLAVEVDKGLEEIGLELTQLA